MFTTTFLRESGNPPPKKHHLMENWKKQLKKQLSKVRRILPSLETYEQISTTVWSLPKKSWKIIENQKWNFPTEGWIHGFHLKSWENHPRNSRLCPFFFRRDVFFWLVPTKGVCVLFFAVVVVVVVVVVKSVGYHRACRLAKWHVCTQTQKNHAFVFFSPGAVAKIHHDSSPIWRFPAVGI